MRKNNPAISQKAESFQVPAIIADVGPEATKRFFEFFTVPIRNKNTRSAYYQAIGQFLDWCQRAGFSNIEDIEPIHVAAYIESHKGSAATIKQHMAAIRMMFSWLTEKGILAINPAREVKTPKFSRTEGKTPAFQH
jgi:integrase/recombinase XerD